MHNDYLLPEDLIDAWPEIFKDISLNIIPLNYVQTVKIIFKNKKIWEFKINKNINIDAQLKEILNQYKNEIKNVKFDVNVEKIKKDASKFNKKYLKLTY